MVRSVNRIGCGKSPALILVQIVEPLNPVLLLTSANLKIRFTTLIYLVGSMNVARLPEREAALAKCSFYAEIFLFPAAFKYLPIVLRSSRKLRFPATSTNRLTIP